MVYFTFYWELLNWHFCKWLVLVSFYLFMEMFFHFLLKLCLQINIKFWLKKIIIMYSIGIFAFSVKVINFPFQVTYGNQLVPEVLRSALGNVPQQAPIPPVLGPPHQQQRIMVRRVTRRWTAINILLNFEQISVVISPFKIPTVWFYLDCNYIPFHFNLNFKKHFHILVLCHNEIKLTVETLYSIVTFL